MELSKTSTEELKKRLAFLEREAKEYDVKQKAVKILSNSLYGCAGNHYFSGYDADLAEGITLLGQLSLKMLDIVVNKLLGEMLNAKNEDFVTYQDTDSCVFDTVIRVNNEQIKIGDFFEQCDTQRVDKLGVNNYVKHVIDSDYYTEAFDGNSVIKKQIKYVMAHKVKKELFKITVGNKSVTITQDHSLVVIRDGSMVSVKPAEVIRGDKIVKLLY